MVFRWIFIPWLQKELDAYRDRLNNTAKRADRNKVLPHGVPNHIFEASTEYGALDFKAGIISPFTIQKSHIVSCQIHIDPAAIPTVRNLYAPPDHPVFELVPPTFDNLARQFYLAMGQPTVSRTNVWDIYLAMLHEFHRLDEAHAHFHNEWKVAFTESQNENANEIELRDDLQDLQNGEDVFRPDGSYYMGGVNNGNGLGECSLDFLHCLQEVYDFFSGDTQEAQLQAMLERDEPDLAAGVLDDGDVQLVAWFSSDDEQDGDEW
jgi:hypothetical protein